MLCSWIGTKEEGEAGCFPELWLDAVFDSKLSLGTGEAEACLPLEASLNAV